MDAAELQRTDVYQWTRQRLALAVLIVAAGLILPSYVVWLQIRPMEGSPRRAAAGRPPRGRAEAMLGKFNLDGLLIPQQRILSGGPSKDGIPSLTEPDTVPVAEADFLAPDSRVVGVTVGGESRAYPINVLNWHEAINDRLGQTDLAVIYCPLCDSVSVVDRKLNGKTYEFGISGLLYNSNVLLYDRTDQALWSQVALTAVSGPNAGRALRHLDGWELTTFSRWRREHPDSTVVTFNTGHNRRYEVNPYQPYFQDDYLMPRFQNFDLDNRLANKSRVIGVKFGGQARAYPLKTLLQGKQMTLRDEVGGGAIELAVDRETQSVRVVSFPENAQVVHTFWFAWAAFHPDTDVYKPPTP